MTKPKTLEGQIHREIQRAIRKYRDNWGDEYFNNFRGNLPGGYRRTNVNENPSLGRFKAWNKDSSELLKRQDISEFFRTIDSVITELGFSQEEFIEFQKMSSDNSERDDFYIEKCTPIYIKLREMGYKHYPDLTG